MRALLLPLVHSALATSSKSRQTMRALFLSLPSLMEILAYSLIDHGLIPDFVLRFVIRRLCRQRLASLAQGTVSDRHDRKIKFVEKLRQQPIAIEQDKANAQHYEVQTDFLQSCLGPRMKYSSCLYPTGKETLAEAELMMLTLYTQRCRLSSLQSYDILDLGCGWGSLSLFLAQQYPKSTITALSNSKTQKLYIDEQAKKFGLSNLIVVTGDVMEYDFAAKRKLFDRILSIEMLEHMKNYEFLFKKISTWLKPSGLFFAQVFCHKSDPYEFESRDGWMAQMFFSGGTMPSLDLFTYFQSNLILEQSWFISGTHYAKTLESWLALQDQHRYQWIGHQGKLSRVGQQQVFHRFRVFFMACAELFALNGGEDWGVAHYVFRKR